MKFKEEREFQYCKGHELIPYYLLLSKLKEAANIFAFKDVCLLNINMQFYLGVLYLFFKYRLDLHRTD